MADGTSTASISKIRIRMGQVEIEYEGSHEYLSEDLPKLLETIVELRQRVGDDADDPQQEDGDVKTNGDKGKISGTVGAIANRLNAKEGPDLIIAAAAKLTLVDGQDSFLRRALLREMQSAKNHYRKSYGSNLSAYLKNLQTDGRLTEPATGQLALTADERKRLEGLLAG
jgi:hypothetical protein